MEDGGFEPPRGSRQVSAPWRQRRALSERVKREPSPTTGFKSTPRVESPNGSRLKSAPWRQRRALSERVKREPSPTTGFKSTPRVESPNGSRLKSAPWRQRRALSERRQARVACRQRGSNPVREASTSVLNRELERRLATLPKAIHVLHEFLARKSEEQRSLERSWRTLL